MFKIKKFLWLFLLSFSIVLFVGCSSDQPNKENKSADQTKSGVNTELLKEQNDLYEKVCGDFSAINQKVIELNDKIHSMKGKLTDDQNKAIDEVEVKRASINTRMHGLKNVSPQEWGNFKTVLVDDIDDVKTQIDEIINGIN